MNILQKTQIGLPITLMLSQYVLIFNKFFFCPTLTHSSVFYQRQLSCYNLGINNVGQRYSVMNLWNETIAKRGSAEIASCILKHILDNFKPLLDAKSGNLLLGQAVLLVKITTGVY